MTPIPKKYRCYDCGMLHGSIEASLMCEHKEESDATRGIQNQHTFAACKDWSHTTFCEVQDCAADQGFDYAFRTYSQFEGVEDRRFHKLRKAYIKAAEALETYIELEARHERKKDGQTE